MSKSELTDSKYLSLGSWRKSGAIVDTPVWFAADAGHLYAGHLNAGHLYVFSASDAGKVKRLRNNPRARVAPCTAAGKLLGEWRAASAEILENKADIEHAYQTLLHRYGWQLRMLDVFSRLGGKINQRAFIRITLLADDAEPV